MNLNLGSGQRSIENYLCIDKSPRLLLSKFGLDKILSPILNRKYETPWDREIKYMDVRRLRFEENSISNIYSSHLLEHLYLYEARELIVDCFRFLEPGGILRLALPDYHAFICRYVDVAQVNPIEAYFQFENSLLSWPLEKQKISEKFMANIFGKLHIHKWHPTPFIVKDFLLEAGFEKVTEYSFRIGKIPGLNLLEDRNQGTFYLEAMKPV